MKILLLANINSSHTRKWALALKDRGLTVGLYSIDLPVSEIKWTSELDLVVFPKKKERFLPLKYLKCISLLRRTVREFHPEILHSHFMTHYSFVAGFGGDQPHIATAWGSDVFAFPKEGWLQKNIFVRNLKKATLLISTSANMAREMQSYVERPVKLIPFGVKLSQYKKRSAIAPLPGSVVKIACYKKIERYYGHHILIKAFAKAIQLLPQFQLQLLIAGTGTLMDEMKKLAEDLNVEKQIFFSGWVDPANIPAQLQEADVCVYTSLTESFGVSLVEAMAAGVPVIASGNDGFMEVIEEDGRNGILVGIEDVDSTAEAIKMVLTDKELYEKLSVNAYQHVKHNYDLDKNIEEQIHVYREVLNGRD